MLAITVVLIPLNTPLWSLVHEAIHKNFHSRKHVNEIGGRIMSILFGASFGVLRFGHLMHHQYNREWESEHYIEPGQNRIVAWFSHYFKMLGGLYLTEVLMSFLIALAPKALTRKIARKIFEDDRHHDAVLNSLLKPENIRKIRIDCLATVIVYAGAFYSFEPDWIIPVVALTGRAVIISLMDNAYHYGTPKDNTVIAKELETVPLYSKFILNFNYHVTHHKNVGLPWTKLAEHHAAQNNPYSERLGRALLAQFKGPIKMRKADPATDRV